MNSRRYDSDIEESGALTYPIAFMCVGTGIIAFLLVYVVPQVADIFAQQHAALPRSTKLVIRLSELVTGHRRAVAMLLLALIVGVRGALQTPSGRRLYDDYYYDVALSCSQRTTVLEPVM